MVWEREGVIGLQERCSLLHMAAALPVSLPGSQGHLYVFIRDIPDHLSRDAIRYTGTDLRGTVSNFIIMHVGAVSEL